MLLLGKFKNSTDVDFFKFKNSTDVDFFNPISLVHHDYLLFFLSETVEEPQIHPRDAQLPWRGMIPV